MMIHARPDRDRPSRVGTMGRRWAVGVCAGLLLMFGALSFSAVLGKSATVDEPVHVVGGFLKRHLHDFRVNPEDPPLLGLLAALPHDRGSLVINVDDEDYKGIGAAIDDEWDFAMGTLYRTATPGGELRSPNAGTFHVSPGDPTNGTPVQPGTVAGTVGGTPLTVTRSGRLVMLVSDGRSVEAGQLIGIVVDADRFINQSRFMFTLVAIGLGVLICRWAWVLAGPAAAVVATTLFALDANFLAHGSLVKNDVGTALLMLALGLSVWRFGRGAGWHLLVLAVICIAALNLKFSSALFAPMIVILLAVRAAIPLPWRLGRWTLATLRARLLVVPVASGALLVLAWAGTWAIYDFRFAPMTDGTLFNTAPVLEVSQSNQLRSARSLTGDAPLPAAEVRATPLGPVVKSTVWMMDHRVLPQGWLFGFLKTYASTLVRPGFLLGVRRSTGWWYYFPLAILFKTPLATLVAAVLAIVIGVRRFVQRRRGRAGVLADDDDDPSSRLDARERRDWARWEFACLIVPPALYALTAIVSNLNIGLRHVLPLYPYAFVGIGIAASSMLDRAPRASRVVVGVLALALAAETLAAYPNYLPFFNVAARAVPSAEGGLNLLSDSNLDWGQDLPLLAEWQRAHLDQPLYLCYFGIADPQYYGIRYHNLPWGYPWGPPEQPLDGPAYVAISATSLQGTYNGDFYQDLREGRPLPPTNHPALLVDVLGKSIYVYRWTP